MKVNRTLSRSCMFIFVAALLTSCGTARLQRPQDAAIDGADQLRLVLATVEAWPMGETNYSEESWRNLFAAARAIQATKPSAAVRALRKYQESFAPPGTFQVPSAEGNIQDRKLFLLMRVVFDLPEAAPGTAVPGWAPSFEGYMRPLLGCAPGDLAWPLTWHLGHPALLSGYVGMQGAMSRYRAFDEYKYFHKKFHFRELKPPE